MLAAELLVVLGIEAYYQSDTQHKVKKARIFDTEVLSSLLYNKNVNGRMQQHQQDQGKSTMVLSILKGGPLVIEE